MLTINAHSNTAEVVSVASNLTAVCAAQLTDSELLTLDVTFTHKARLLVHTQSIAHQGDIAVLRNASTLVACERQTRRESVLAGMLLAA